LSGLLWARAARARVSRYTCRSDLQVAAAERGVGSLVCGIVGFVAAPSAPAPDPARIEAATTALAHRGPDSGSVWFGGRVALGHRRLEIIDLENGDQPMMSEDGNVVVVYNGEIWNHLELRAELEAAGHVFRSRCDTEVLVHGYEEWGESMLDRLAGMFAFALWNVSKSRLLLARDRVGKKPLYVVESAAGVAFASDARAALIAAGETPTLDRGAVAEYLFQRYTAAPRTLLRGVERLRPGHVLVYDGTLVHRRAYWRLDPQDPEPLSPRELRGLVEDAVRRRLMSDVPIGVLLSGGVDSSAVAALMHHVGARDFATFTVGFDDPVYDERQIARQTAARLGTDHHEVVLQPRDFVDAIARLVWYRDEPLAEPSEVPLLLLAELAGRHVKVVLTGDGGDEIFGGYPKYRAERFLRFGDGATRPALRKAASIAARRPTHRQLERAAETLAIADPTLRWASWFRSFSAVELGSLLVPELRPTAASLAAPLEGVLEPYRHLDPTRRMLVGDFLTYLPDNMLLRGDKVLMAASVEGRMPLLDHRIVERVSNARSGRVGLRRAKMVLRAAVADVVPEHVLRQPKRGFPVPITQILLQDGRLTQLLSGERTLERGLFDPNQLRDLVAGTTYTRGRDLKIFTVAALELWLRSNVDEVRLTPPASLAELLDEDERPPEPKLRRPSPVQR
jgi:asparagine synthase (glutamine-hydrolysing)